MKRPVYFINVSTCLVTFIFYIRYLYIHSHSAADDPFQFIYI